MRTEDLVAEAQECRRWAPELAGPDGRLLLKIAERFEQLADAQKLSGSEPSDGSK